MSRWIINRNCGRTHGRRRRLAERHRHGGVVVEFAVVAPLFFLLLFGSIEMARMNMMRHAADNAAYEAARHAIVPGGTTAEAISRANASLAVYGFQGANVFCTPTTLSNTDQELTVTVELPFDQNAWVFPRFTQGKLVRSSSTLRTERYRPLQ